MTVESATIGERYEKIWADFVHEINQLQFQIKNDVGHQPDLHSILRNVQSTPYRYSRALFIPVESDASSGNIGSVTGFFFEQLAISIIVPYVRLKCPNVRVELNIHSDRGNLQVPRDPDLYFRLGDRRVVVEIKASPKKGDLEYVSKIRTRYQKANISFYCVGGWVSVAKEYLRELGDQGWACFTHSSKRNRSTLNTFPSLDVILQKIVDDLQCV